MPDLITAPTTREVVSFGIERCQDQNRTIFPTDFELFDYINIICREIVRSTKILKSDVYIKLIPNQVEYGYNAILDEFTNIVQIETVTILDINDIESTPLQFRNKKDFRNDILGKTSITSPLWYSYDGINIAYWRPTTLTTDRLKIRASRELQKSEEAGQDIDPPQELINKFLPYIKYGLVREMATSRPDNDRLKSLVQIYDRLYQKYIDVELTPKTLDTHRAYMRSF